MLDYEIHGGKGGAEKPHTPVETPNNLLSVAYAKVLIAVAEGELAGVPTDQDIFLDGTPLANSDGTKNFGGVTWEWRSGTSDQTYIAGLPEVATEYSVGVELKSGFPYVRNVTKTQLDAVRITFQWPALLQQKSNGDTVGVSMDYKVEIQTDDGAFTEYKTYNINGKTNSSYERTHRIDLPKATRGWNIRVTRVTPESESGQIQDTMNIKSVAEVVDVKQRYPNTAMLFVQFDSRMFGGGAIPKVSVRTKGRIIRVPSNYDPVNRTYVGVWAGDFKWAWSDNPAWVYHDIVTQDRFGLGHKVSLDMVDKWALYEVAQYCDVMVDDGLGAGVKQPRHTCNVYVQEKQDAWQVLRDMASIFNGMTYWNGTQFTVIADKQEAFNNAPIFSRSNVANGRFDYTAADDKSIYTSALVSYDDPDNHYNTNVESTFETSQILRWGGDRQVEISAIGCTSRGEAQRRGKYTLVTNMYNRTVSFRTGLQGMNDEVLPGKLIHVVDPLIGGRQFTGRLKAAAGNVITLDRDIDGKPGDIMYVTRKNGVTEGRTIQSVFGNVVTLQVGYTEQPVANAVWYLEAADLKSQLFRVTKVSIPSESVFEIEAVEYNDSKYAAIDNGARLEPRPISVVPPDIQKAPTNVKLTSYTYVEQTMAVTSMVLSWDQMANAVGYEAQWKVGDGDWVNLGVTGANEITVKGIYAGRYVGRVRAINAFGIKSTWASSAITNLEGKAGTPPSVTDIVITGLIFGMRLDWYFPPGAEDTLMTEFRYSQTPSFEASIPLGDFAYPINSHEMHGLKAGQNFWFWCRLRDRTGNVGPWFPSNTAAGRIGQTMINTDGAYNDYFAGLIGATALDKTLYDRIELIDGDGPNSVNDRLNQAVSELEDQIANITDALVYDPDKDGYSLGDIVRLGNKLYQAQKAVPKGIAPPNLEYWKDVGTILEQANVVVSQVAVNTQNIEKLDDVVTATATQINGITAQFRDDDGEGALQDAIASHGTKAQIVVEQQVRATEDQATAERLTIISAEAQNTKASLTTLETATSARDAALASRIDTVEASAITTAQVNALIQTETTARVNADNALATSIQTVQAKADDNSAVIQTVSSAQATTAGKVNTAWTLKMEVNSNGQYVAAGIGLGIENGPAGLQSQFLIRADRFAVVAGANGTTSAPFVIQNGQVFISDALISKATITNAIIGSYIYSSQYTTGGEPIMTQDFTAGQIVIRHPSRASTYTAFNSSGIQVVVDGVLRVRMGTW